MRRSLIRFIVSFCLYYLIFFGVGYKPFYSFDLDRNTGQGDSISYVKMHDGNFEVSPVHKYRVGISFISNKLTGFIGLQDTDQLKANNAPVQRLSIFIVNTFIVSLTASVSLLLALYLLRNSHWVLTFSLICIGFMNPATIQKISTPMVDSPVPLFAVSIAYISLINLHFFAPIFSTLLMPFNERIIIYLPMMLVKTKSKI